MDGFIILGNMNAITYKGIFPYIKNNELWLGRTLFTGKMTFFKVPNDYPLENDRIEKRDDGLYKQVNSICWFTNIPHNKICKPLILTKTYNPNVYPKYDNYDAIEVSRTENIPMDYEGVMGVPITFLDKYCPTQFEIVGCANAPFIGGKGVYKRILIRRRYFFENILLFSNNVLFIYRNKNNNRIKLNDYETI